MCIAKKVVATPKWKVTVLKIGSTPLTHRLPHSLIKKLDLKGLFELIYSMHNILKRAWTTTPKWKLTES